MVHEGESDDSCNGNSPPKPRIVTKEEEIEPFWPQQCKNQLEYGE